MQHGSVDPPGGCGSQRRGDSDRAAASDSQKACPQPCPELSSSDPPWPHSAAPKCPHLRQKPCKWATLNPKVGGSIPPRPTLRAPYSGVSRSRRPPGRCGLRREPQWRPGARDGCLSHSLSPFAVRCWSAYAAARPASRRCRAAARSTPSAAISSAAGSGGSSSRTVRSSCCGNVW